jgi:hypothetical protein
MASGSNQKQDPDHDRYQRETCVKQNYPFPLAIPPLSTPFPFPWSAKMSNGLERPNDSNSANGNGFRVAADQRAGRARDQLLTADDIISGEGQRFDGQGESMARRRYQKGRVILRGKANPVWVGRWREDVIGTDGVTRRIERSEILGSKSEIPTQRLALRRLEVLISRINAPDYRPGRMATLAGFAERWKETVLSQHKPSSQKAALSHLHCHILPQLGNVRLDALGIPDSSVLTGS